ncbi:hypothetical protein SH1V18_03230 [Vallitalea longa]|uniref:Large polyvalent protein associated domain-containing protein n=1 Tax=Vallitalea longa TaxID=2936439 RepID=A0A9W6DDZ2_9FIRM|nr:hypothetical protein [Vallitalea longa]GKX27843.1 hypothetical protein SH1V18_03230 [Vallitalea longa]
MSKLLIGSELNNNNSDSKSKLLIGSEVENYKISQSTEYKDFMEKLDSIKPIETNEETLQTLADRYKKPEVLKGYIEPDNNWYNFKQGIKKQLGKVKTVLEGVGTGLAKPFVGGIQTIEENSDIPENYQIKEAFTPEAKERQIKENLGYTPYAELNKGEKRLLSGGELAGTLGRYGLTYAVGAPLISKATNPAVQSILQSGLNPAVTQMGAATAPRLLRGIAATGVGAGVEDLILGTPQGMLDAKAEGKKGLELAKDTGENILLDAVSNLVFKGAGEAIDLAKILKNNKAAKQSVETVEKAIKELPQLEAEKIINQEAQKVINESDINDIVKGLNYIDKEYKGFINDEVINQIASNSTKSNNFDEVLAKTIDDLSPEKAKEIYNSKLDDYTKTLLNTSNNGVEKGYTAKKFGEEGYYRVGATSYNPQWYSRLFKEYNGKPPKYAIRQEAERHLKNGISESGVKLKPDIMFNKLSSKINNSIDTIIPNIKKEALNIPVNEIDNIISKNIDNITDAKELENIINETKQLLGTTNDKQMKLNLQMFADKAQKKLKELAEESYKSIEANGPRENLSFSQGRIDVEGLKKSIGDIVEKHPLEYNAINNKDTLTAAKKLVQQNFEASKNMVRDGKVYNNAVESAVGMETIEKLFKDKQYDEAFELLEKHSDKLKRMGQANQIAATWARTTPEGMTKWTDKLIKEAKEKGLKFTTEDTKAFKEKIYKEMEVIQGIDSPEEMISQIEKTYGKKLPKWVDNQLSKQTQDKLKEIATEQVLNEVRGLIKPSIWKKISTYQAMSHLINIPTAMRNIFGNLSFNEAERLSNLFSIPIDKITSIKTGERTLTAPTSWRKTIVPAIDRAKDSAMYTKLGINSDVGKYTIQRGSAFNGKLGKTGEKVLSYELKVPDEFFKGQIKQDVLNQQMKLAGVTKPTKEMIDIAEEEMLYRTFQDDSLPSKVLQGLKDVFNNAGFGQKIRGSSGIITKEFGLGDLIIKYPRVPGNIISRVIEYTPAGYLKGIYNLAKVGKNPKLQHKAAMAFGRATNGSLMIGMAALMHQKGLLISDDADKDKDLKSLEKSEGLGGLKVNLSAIERLLEGESTQLQKGDELSTLNWIEPIGKSWAIGAAIDREVKKDKSTQEVATASLNQALEEVLDLPTLSIVKSMFYTGMNKDSSKFDVMITPVTEAIPGFVSGPIRQAAQVTDPVQREQYSGKPTERLQKRIKASIPGMSKSLVPSVSSLGEELTPQGTDSRAFFNRLINPAIQTTYKPNEFTNKLKDIEKYTGKTTVYPSSIAPSYVTKDKVKYTLTDSEKADYLKISGQIIKDKLKDIGEVTEDNAEKKAKKVEKIIRDAREEAKKHILEERKNIIPKVGGR